LAVQPVLSLSIHADYRCRHSGRCCSTDWDVPIELPVYRTLTEAMTAGRLRTSPAAASLPPFVVGPDLPDETAAVFERTDAGTCVFFDHGSRLCIVHRDLGEPALPATCRHFPRLAVRDRRGTSITLSHFCPTAASMLFRRDVALEIVSGPPAFPPADYEGLSVADDDLPPLLHPGMLTDIDGYRAWEAHMVSRCADVERDPDAVLATLMRDARRLRGWSPGGGSLRDAIRALGDDPVIEGPAHRTLTASRARHADAMRAVPPEFVPAPDDEHLEEAFASLVRPAWHRFHAPLNLYVAAKSFASWTAYQGQGLATIVRGLEAALALVRVEAARQCRDARRSLDEALLLEAFRSADFILNHLAVGEDLAAGWATVEREADTGSDA
jgi:hypothetical protein